MFQSMTRRGFMAGAAALATMLPLRGRAQATTLIPRETLFGDDYRSWAQLSEDGRHISWIAPANGVRNLWVAPLDDLAAARPVTRATDRPIGTYYRWAYDNRRIVFFQERDGDENWRASSVDIESGSVVPLTPERGVRSRLQERSRRFPNEMLIAHNGRDKRLFDLFRVNLTSGASERVFENDQFNWLFTDSAFQLRFASHVLKDGSVEWLERRPSGGWAHFMTIPVGDVDGTRLEELSYDGKTLYYFESRGRDKSALMAMDVATRKARMLAEDPNADIKDVLLDKLTYRPLAASATYQRQNWQAVEPGFAPHLKAMRAATKGEIWFASLIDDRSKALAYVDRSDGGPEYAIYDRNRRAMRTLFKLRPALEGLPLRPMEAVTVKARDGLPIPCYLTLPESGARNVPMVMAIHGGPYWRDTWGYNSTHQWLANRGYAVLNVNFRGSTGFGKKFVTAADGEWGGKMHDDLMDARAWAVAQSIADPNKIAFYGASYGGYAALTAATKTPESFTCIVDIFGIANLITFMAAIPPYWKPWFPVWKKRVGDPDTPEGQAFLKERSPLTHIQRAFRPILIVQGLEDVRVTRAESEQMVEALKARNVPVTYITFSDEGHGFNRPENQVAFRAVTEAFLVKHLGGRAEPIDRARDFRGSTLKVEAGAGLIPGLSG